MKDIQKEQFAFELYTYLQDEFEMVDYKGTLARQIQEASGQRLNKIINILKTEIIRNMK